MLGRRPDLVEALGEAHGGELRLPASECVTRPAKRPARREVLAISSASSTMSVRMWAATLQPTIMRRIGVGDEADIGHARPRRDIGQIRDPQAVGMRGREVALDEVRRSAGVGIGSGGEHLLAALAHALECPAHA